MQHLKDKIVDQRGNHIISLKSTLAVASFILAGIYSLAAILSTLTLKIYFCEIILLGCPLVLEFQKCAYI